MSQKDTAGFAGRLAYVRWLRARGRPASETDKELAAATGIGYAWLAKWKGRKDAPDTRSIANRFVRGLGLTPEHGEWLLEGKGEPPEPSLWKVWSDRPSYQRVAEQVETYMHEARPTRKPGRRAGGKRKDDS